MGWPLVAHLGVLFWMVLGGRRDASRGAGGVERSPPADNEQRRRWGLTTPGECSAAR